MKKRDEWDEKDFISLERKYRVLIMIVTLCPRIVQLIWSCIKCVIIAWEEEVVHQLPHLGGKKNN